MGKYGWRKRYSTGEKEKEINKNAKIDFVCHFGDDQNNCFKMHTIEMPLYDSHRWNRGKRETAALYCCKTANLFSNSLSLPCPPL